MKGSMLVEMDEWTKPTSAVASATAYLGVKKKGDVVGWGVVQKLWTPGNSEIQDRRFSGILLNATANRTWLVAAAEGLEGAEGLAEYKLIAPASYLTSNLGLTLRGWEVDDWVKSDGDPVANRDIWERILTCCRSMRVSASQPSSTSETTLCDEAKSLASDAIAAHAQRDS